FCSFYRHLHRADLPPFPTRRSSDLSATRLARRHRSGTPCKGSHNVGETTGTARVNNRQRRVGRGVVAECGSRERTPVGRDHHDRSEEHTSELQSLTNLVCRLLLVKN